MLPSLLVNIGTRKQQSHGTTTIQVLPGAGGTDSPSGVLDTLFSLPLHREPLKTLGGQSDDQLVKMVRMAAVGLSMLSGQCNIFF